MSNSPLLHIDKFRGYSINFCNNPSYLCMEYWWYPLQQTRNICDDRIIYRRYIGREWNHLRLWFFWGFFGEVLFIKMWHLWGSWIFSFHIVSPNQKPLTLFQQYFSHIVAVSVIGGESHRPVASHWQIVSHNVVSSSHHLSGIRTKNFREILLLYDELTLK